MRAGIATSGESEGGCEPFALDPADSPTVRGFLHRPRKANGDGWVLTHGAGGNCGSPLLVSLANAFSDAGLCVLRCDLPFRQARCQGPPRPGGAANDREGLRAAVETLRSIAPGRIFLGGHSYGGRQATMLASEDPAIADGLVLLSYPLHPPRKPDNKRTQHFPQLHIPALFLHGTRDPFGVPKEMEQAVKLIPARTTLALVEGVGHSLVTGKSSMAPADVSDRIWAEFQSFFGASRSMARSEARG